MAIEFGAKLMQHRLDRGITLRRFAKSVGLDPSYYSRIERGEATPPNEETIARFATALGIVVGVSPEWNELYCLAVTERGRMPSLRPEQREIAAMLPAFFARLRDHDVRTPRDLYRVCLQLAKEQMTPMGEDTESMESMEEAVA